VAEYRLKAVEAIVTPPTGRSHADRSTNAQALSAEMRMRSTLAGQRDELRRGHIYVSSEDKRLIPYPMEEVLPPEGPDLNAIADTTVFDCGKDVLATQCRHHEAARRPSAHVGGIERTAGTRHVSAAQ
jgi:hypothetical protein